MAGNVAGFFFFLLILTRSRNVCVLNTHSARGPHSFTAHRKKSRARAGLSGMEEGMPQTTLHLDRASCAQEAESRA